MKQKIYIYLLKSIYYKKNPSFHTSFFPLNSKLKSIYNEVLEFEYNL